MSEKRFSESQNNDDKLSTGLTIASFCFPIVGIFVYFSNKGTNPNKAQSACHAALWGFGIGIVLNIFVRLAGSN